MSTIDFSGKSGVFIRNPEGTIQPIKEPYFRRTRVADGVWQILSDGDFSYLIEGDNEALVVDTGYGSGNLREFCEAVTGKPVKRAVNTGYGLRRTANNSVFGIVYMSEATYAAGTEKLKSFEGVVIPQDYMAEIISDGFTIDLGGREITAISFPACTAGGLVFFDSREKILFTGGEMNDFMLVVNHMSVEELKRRLERIAPLQGETDLVCAGDGIFCSFLIKRMIQNANRVLGGYDSLPMIAAMAPAEPERRTDGSVIYDRGSVRPEDRPADDEAERSFKRFSGVAECKIVYDIRRVRD